MDQKSWLWKKRSTEKSLAAEKATYEEETEDEELRMSITEEAIAGWERAKREVISLKKEVDKVLREKSGCEERLRQVDAALKVVRQEQDNRVHSAVMKASQEFEKRIARLQGENSELHRALSAKEKVIDELRRYTSEVEADSKARMLTEKENASLKYEVRVLEKELEIRNEEAEVSRRTADIAQRQQRESLEKIVKLESECARLRLLMRRRLPGPAALTKMKNEVEMLGKDDAETRRRSKAPSKRINFPLTEKLVRVEALNKKSRLSMESGKYLFLKEEEHSVSDLDSSDDRGSCAESWPSLENLKNEKRLCNRYMGTPEMKLMDDFAEMEKLAVEFPAFDLEVSGTANEKDVITTKMNDEKLESNVSVPVGKILELLEGINAAAEDDKISSLANPTGYIVRVFQWKTDELSALVQQLFQTCSDLLNGETDVEQFVQVVASSLEWIMNHCFSIQDVSSIKDAIRSRLDWDELSGEDSCSAAKSTRLIIQSEDVSCIPSTEQADIGSSASEEVIKNLQSEKETTRKSIGENGDQIEKQMIMKEGLEIQLMETILQQGKASSHMENDLENTNSSFERYENDQNTQLQCHTNEEGQADASRNQLRNDWEITTASEKLAECQETLLNLGKQLKALTSPRARDEAMFDKVISIPADHAIASTPTPSKLVSKRFSLQDKMIEEDKDQTITSPSPRTTDGIQDGNYNSATSTNAVGESWGKFTNPNGIDREADKTAIVSMAIVPRKKSESRSLLKKLLLWKTKGNRKKTPPLKQH